MRPLLPHERDDIVAVLGIKIQQDGFLDDYDSAALSRELLESNNWDLNQAALEYDVRETPASPPKIVLRQAAAASSSRGPDVFKYAALMDAVLDEAEAQPASKYHVVSINLAPGSNFPTDEEVQYMSLMDLRDLSEYESGDLTVCVG
jgi:hypothetical protein